MDAKKDLHWLINANANEADFVYAILKSSMFKAWCELTACTSYTDSAGTQHRGAKINLG